MATTEPEATVTIVLTKRQLTLVRVACLTRLDQIKDRDLMRPSYEETRALLEMPDGALYRAMVDANKLP